MFSDWTWVNILPSLLQDGGLFTFGDGSWGQLGHGSTSNELLPRRVLELMGTEVSQITCGRYFLFLTWGTVSYFGLHLNLAFVRHHTLAFAPTTGVVYAFGGNSHGQLGTGQLSADKSPYPVKTNFLSGNVHGTGRQHIFPVRSDSRHFSLEMLN